MNLLLQHSINLFFRPRLAFRRLLEGNRRVGYGIFGTLILALVYIAGISTKMAMNAMHVPEFLVLNIPPARYYSTERFFIIPAALAGTILAAGIIRLAAQGWKGQGNFEDLFALLGFSMVEHLGWRKSILLGLVGFAVNGAVSAIFMR